MKRILLTPIPSGDGGPSLAVRRMMPYLVDSGFKFTSQFWSNWDLAFVNVGGGRYGVAGVMSRRPFLYRAAGYYVKDIFIRNERIWSWRYDFSNLLTRLYLRYANWVVFQSDYAKDILIDAFGAPRAFSVINNGVDLVQYQPLQKKYNKIPIIGSVGKMRHERIRDLIRVSEAMPQKHQMIVVGSMEESDHKLLLTSGKQRGVEIKVTGHLPADQVLELYREIDVLLHLAAADVCPNVVVEALACGLPVVGHAYGGTAELVGNGGFSIPGTPYHNDNSFIAMVVDAVEQVLADLPSYRQQARARAEAVLDIRKTAAGYSGILQAISRR